MADSRWGTAIKELLADRGWTQRQLAERAKVRPNTLTTLIRHGGESDTKTLKRIAAALDVDIGELFMSTEQRAAWRTREEQAIERITNSVMGNIAHTVNTLVREALEQLDVPGPHTQYHAARSARAGLVAHERRKPGKARKP